MTIPLATLQSGLWPDLHATGESDAVFVTAADLERVISDRLKGLAMDYGIYVVRDIAFITLVAGRAVYDLPPRHLSTIHVAHQGRPLVASARAELERLDVNYQTTPATALKLVRRWYQDKHGFNRLGFHPVPAVADAGSKVEVIYFRYPCEVDAGIDGPLIIGDLLHLLTLGDVYSRESDFSQPETAQSAHAVAQLMTAQFANLWGMAQ